MDQGFNDGRYGPPVPGGQGMPPGWAGMSTDQGQSPMHFTPGGEMRADSLDLGPNPMMEMSDAELKKIMEYESAASAADESVGDKPAERAADDSLNQQEFGGGFDYSLAPDLDANAWLRRMEYQQIGRHPSGCFISIRFNF